MTNKRYKSAHSLVTEYEPQDWNEVLTLLENNDFTTKESEEIAEDLGHNRPKNR